MQFLSVAARELRVAARKPNTFRARILTAGIALFICGFSLWFVTLFGSRPISGEQLFRTLSWVSFFFACIVGPALTADTVNEERNNGTLGLLFLTNLPAISLSLGKLIAHGLLALYSIVSIIPVMALPVLLGGTDAKSLAKTALVLSGTLILSLIVGMFASTVCRKPWVAAALALFILALLVLGIPLACLILRLNHRADLSAWLELLSPSYSLLMARPSAVMLSTNHLWPALGVQVILALSFFGLINFLLPRVWQEGRPGRIAPLLHSTWRAIKYGPLEARRQLRTRLLQINPILWLSSRERFGPLGPAMLLLLLAFPIFWIARNFRLGPAANDPFLGAMIAWIVGMPLLYLTFCFRLAAAASERFAIDRKAGALELILSTPINAREIIRGHWLGLIRRFWGAAILLLALHAFTLNYIMQAIPLHSPLRGFGLRELLAGPLRHFLGTAPINNDIAFFYIASLAVLTSAILIVILWIALAWLGMALSLKLRREILAPWISLILLAVPPLPLFVCTVAFLENIKIFAANAFPQGLTIGMSGFFIVLSNALLWLFLARRWTYAKLRATS